MIKGIRNPPINVKYAMTLDLNFMLSIVDEIKNIINKTGFNVIKVESQKKIRGRNNLVSLLLEEKEF